MIGNTPGFLNLSYQEVLSYLSHQDRSCIWERKLSGGRLRQANGFLFLLPLLCDIQKKRKKRSAGFKVQLIAALLASKPRQALLVQCQALHSKDAGKFLPDFTKVLYAHAFVCAAFPCLPRTKQNWVSYIFFKYDFLKPVYFKKTIELSLTHGSSCPSNAACPLVLVYFSPMLHCYCFLFLQEIFLRISKPTELLPLHVLLWYCKKRAKRRAGVVRTVTT